MGITKIVLYRVHCDGCGMLFANEEPPLRHNENHLYTTYERAEIGIQPAGWVVLHNRRELTPRIVCPRCAKEAGNGIMRVATIKLP